jgi:nitroimidazol reductase NimA-like FMN-containing flavoprotein (pyridoxamine 5'-phosphate oxidase superfamily)
MDGQSNFEVTVLNEPECWTLLRSSSTGRLAVISGEGPDIFPLNYVVDHGTLVFRTGAGAKINALQQTSQVAFEVDGYHPDTGQVWSVVIKGGAERITSLYEGLDALVLPLAPWQAGVKPHFVRIVPTAMTGRRFTVVDPDIWHNPLAEAPAQAPE